LPAEFRSAILSEGGIVAVSPKLLGVSLAFSALACAADPALLNLVMPEARVFAGINVERILASPIGKQIGSRIQKEAPQLQQIFDATGFDLRRDLKEILIAGTSQGQSAASVVLVRGSFDAAKLGTFLTSSGQTPIVFEGVQILSNPSQKSSSFAILENNIAVAGDLDQVKAAIRRLKQGTMLSAEISNRIATLSEHYDIWFQATGSLMPPDAKITDARFQQAGDLIKSITQISGGLRCSSGVDLSAEVMTHSEKEAASILGVLQLFTGFLTANQQSPGALKPDAIKLKSEGKTVRLTLRITEEQLKQAYEAQQARLRQSASAAAITPKPRPADTGLVIQGSSSDMGTVHLPRSN
jgi:hypothetical protein